MASTESLRAIDLGPSHIGGAMDLVAEAGWNQVSADWRMMMEQGAAFGFEEPGGRLVGTAAILLYGANFGWISMVLVTQSWQRRGLATQLLTQAIDRLEAGGRTPVLDATPPGEKVYSRLGFTPRFGFHRWQRGGDRPVASELSAFVRQAEMSDVDALVEYDRAVFGGERAEIIANIARRGAPGFVSEMGGAHGLSRAGRVAHQLGPISAGDTQTAIDLFRALAGQSRGPAFIDVVDDQRAFAAAVEAAGFVPQRGFTRMVHGDADFGDRKRMFGLAGPELG